MKIIRNEIHEHTISREGRDVRFRLQTYKIAYPEINNIEEVIDDLIPVDIYAKGAGVQAI